MSLKLKRCLITVLCAFVLLFASLAIFVAPNNAITVSAEVIGIQLEGVEDNYIVNAKETFPVSVTNNDEVFGDGVVIYPNGKVYKIVKDKEFTLNVAGGYTLRYYGENQIVEKTFLVSQKHFVLSSEETELKNEIVAATEELMEGQQLPNGENFANSSDWPNMEQNLTTFGNEALIVRMEAGTKFTYSVPIDLTKAEADGLTNIIKFQPRWGNYDKSRANSAANYIMELAAKNIVVTLTDCYDSSRYVRFIVQEGGDTNYARAGTDNLLDAGWVFPTTRKVTSDMPAREFYEGTEYGFAYIGNYGTGTPAGLQNEWVRRDGIYFKYDYDDAQVYATSFNKTGVADYQEDMIADFNNKSVYPSADFRGFTTGEVYLSIEFTDYQSANPARVDIYEIAGIKAEDLIAMRETDETGDPTKLVVDTKQPVIDLDFKPTVSDGVYVDVGTNFTVPTAVAYDVNLKGDLKVGVYRNYSDVAHRVSVPIVNGKVQISEEDVYSIVYIAEDSCGNKTEKVIKVFGVNDDSNRSIAFDCGNQLANLEAGKIYSLPKFTFDTKNNAEDRKVKITISNKKETLVIADLKSGDEIEEFLAKDVKFNLSYSGEYTVEYVYSDNANSGVVSYALTSSASDVVSFPNSPFLQRYLIKDAVYDFEEIWAYSYETGSEQPKEVAEVYIAYDADINETDLSLSTWTKLDSVYSNKITGSSKAVLMYKYGSNAVYTDIATIVDTNIGEVNKSGIPTKLKQFKYFVGDFATGNPEFEADGYYSEELFDPEIYYPEIDGTNIFNSSTLEYKSKVKTGSNTLQFVNMIDVADFSFYYRIIDDTTAEKDADNFNALKLVFTDPYDTDNQVYAKIYKIGDSVYLDLNGEQTSKVSQVFSGNVDKYFSYNLSTRLFSVSGVSTKMKFDFGFTTTKAYFDIVFEDINGVAGIRVMELNGHKFAHDGRARTLPIALMSAPQGNYSSGTVITVSPAEFIDVLSPIIKENVSLTVTGPGGDEDYLTALDGTLLDETCDPYKTYQIRLDVMGQYKVNYSAKSGIGQKSNPPGYIFVTDLAAPEITFKGDIEEGCVVYLKPGQKLKVGYTVTDDTSLSENIFSRIIWSNKYLAMAGLFEDNTIYFIKEGTYEVGVSAMDELGNFSRKTFTVIVTEEEVK